jgi:uncharacterized protein
MSDDPLHGIEQEARRQRNYDSPPLHLWHPPLSGDIPIRIAADGRWFHDGDLIERESLVRLFASILRREEDGDYYLVTPAEKWRIEVELHPLIVTGVENRAVDGRECLEVTLNTGKKVMLGEDHPLFLEPRVGDIAAVRLDHGLTALFSRAAWYRLVESARESAGVPSVSSKGLFFPLVPEQA